MPSAYAPRDEVTTPTLVAQVAHAIVNVPPFVMLPPPVIGAVVAIEVEAL